MVLMRGITTMRRSFGIWGKQRVLHIWEKMVCGMGPRKFFFVFFLQYIRGMKLGQGQVIGLAPGRTHVCLVWYLLGEYMRRRPAALMCVEIYLYKGL